MDFLEILKDICEVIEKVQVCVCINIPSSCNTFVYL